MAVRRAALILGIVVGLTLGACSPDSSSPARGPAIGMDVRRPVRAQAPLPATDASEDEEGGGGPSGPPAAVVPDVRGLVFSRAVHLLWRAGIDFDLVMARESGAPLWAVIQETPAPGTDTPPSGKVTLVLSLHHHGGAGVIGTVRCKPESGELHDPYCLGKLLKYSAMN